MFILSTRCLLVFLLVSPSLLLMSNQGLAKAEEEQDETIDEEEEVPDEDDEGTVEDDEAEVEDDEGEVAEEETDSAVTEDDTEPKLGPHPDTETAILFSSGQEAEIIAGKAFTSYVHFSNTGSKNFIITKVLGSFRYPQDYSYVIQNFTQLPLNKMIDGGKEGSFMYQFMAAEMAAGRPFGLVITLNYKDTEDNLYEDTVYNKTITVLENEEGVDTETFFMYVILTALAGLGIFGLVHLVTSKSKRTRRHAATKPMVETGTTKGDVDLSWIPQATLNSMHKGSPSPRRSPKKRASKRAPANEAE